jgi:HEAT repeat protein
MKETIIIISVFFVLLGQSLNAEVAAPSTLFEKRIDSIFVIASSAELKYRSMVEPAKDSIAAMGADAVPRLVELYKSNTAREQRAVDDIMEKIGTEAVPYLRRSLTFDDFRQVSRVCYVLGEIGDSSAVVDLIDVTIHKNWQVRSGSAGALGKICDGRASEIISGLLSDSVETVRKSAAVAAGQLQTEMAVEKLVHLLGDDHYGPRMCASEALVQMGDRAVKTIIDSLDSENSMVGDLGCITLGRMGDEAAVFGVADQLKSDMPIRRVMAVEAIFLSGSSLACGLVEILKETETDSLVLFYIDKTMKKYASR